MPVIDLSDDGRFKIEWPGCVDIVKRAVPCVRRGDTAMVNATYANAYRLAARIRYAEWTPAAKRKAAEAYDHAAHRGSAVGATDTEGLSPAQAEGVSWLRGGSGILADEMGSGKTVQACVALKAYSGPVLVVAPNSVVEHWVDHIRKWTGRDADSVTSAIYGPERPTVVRGLVEIGTVVVIPWSLVSRLSKQKAFGNKKRNVSQHTDLPLSEIDWDVVIIDEAHRAKNPQAAQTRAVWGISAKTTWALTGTPVSESPLDWWSMMRIVDPASWPARGTYIRDYCHAQPMPWGGMDVAFSDTAVTELRALTDWMMLRRKMTDVIGREITKERTVVQATLSNDHMRAYKALRDELVLEFNTGSLSAPNALALAVRLQQMSAAMLRPDGDGGWQMCEPSPKCDELERILLELEDTPVVVMSESKQLLKLARARLTKAGRRVAEVSGDITGLSRTREVQRFSSGEADTMLATCGAGGEGVDFSAARHLVMLQRPYSLIKAAQSEDRVRRWTQDAGAVEIIDVVTKDTVDERIRKALQKKSSMAAKLTGAEILELL